MVRFSTWDCIRLGTDRPVRFSRPGAVRVFCNIHPSMSAIILVLNTPYFTKTARNGTFQTHGSRGELRVARVSRAGDSGSGSKPLTQRIFRSARSKRSGCPEIAVSEAGYVPGPHKNKYGRDYPPEADSETYTPGTRN